VEVTEKELEVTAPPLTSKKKTMPKKPKKQKVIAPSFVRPFLKWPGGKYSVLAQVLPHLGEGNRLIEPFAGSGVVSMNAPQFDRYLLADTNRDLIGLYIGAGVANIIDLARPLFRDMNSRGDYETLRAKFNSNKMGMAERAATFLYINRHSFNGLIRYNLAGRINSPFGYYKAPYFPFDELTAFKEQYSRYEFKCQSFVDTIREARAGDVVFCDPPYMPLPDKEGFTSYTKDPFTDEHHWQLLNEMVQAAQRGARVVVTNSGAPSLHENYTKQGFKIYPLYARRSMSCKGGTRGVAADIIGVLDIE
jgi:DNA (cytosine-5)-methyltransferase 1